LGKEDSDLSITEWTPDLRVCLVSKYLQNVRQAVLQFKCGYKTFVTAEVFYDLGEESLRFHQCTQEEVRDSVQVAMQEWSDRVAVSDEDRLASERQNRERLARNLQEKIAKEKEAREALCQMQRDLQRRGVQALQRYAAFIIPPNEGLPNNNEQRAAAQNNETTSLLQKNRSKIHPPRNPTPVPCHSRHKKRRQASYIPTTFNPKNPNPNLDP
jgi:hypothetical protein